MLDRFHNPRVLLAKLIAGADGRFTTTVDPNGHFKPGPFTLVVVSAGVDLAQATIRVTTAPSIAPERLTTTPKGVHWGCASRRAAKASRWGSQ